MELLWLEDFLALAETRNFSRAAERRNVTQPAFSRRVRAFEDWLGVALFERSSRGVTLTRAGEHVLGHAGEIVRRVADIRREVRAIAGLEREAVRFAATHALSFTFFPGWIRESAAGLGAVRLISDSMAACEQVLRRGDADFLLCHHDPSLGDVFEPGRFASVVVGSDVIAPLSAPNGEGAPRFPLTASGAAVRTLSYGEQSGIGRIVAARAKGAQPAPAFTSQLSATLLSMAAAGEGMAWLPLTLAADALREGRLVRAAGADADIGVEIRVFRASARLGSASEAFWAALFRG